MIQKIFIILTLIFSSVSHAEEKPAPTPPIGFVFSVGPTQCVFEPRGPAPKIGDIIWVMVPKIEGKNKVFMAQIKEELKLSKNDYPKNYENTSPPENPLPLFGITLKTSSTLDLNEVGLGFILTKGSAVLGGNKTLKLKDPAQDAFYLTRCFGMEGINFILNKEDQAKKQHTVWSQYYPLEYSVGQVQNACTKEDLPKE